MHGDDFDVDFLCMLMKLTYYACWILLPLMPFNEGILTHSAVCKLYHIQFEDLQLPGIIFCLIFKFNILVFAMCCIPILESFHALFYEHKHKSYKFAVGYYLLPIGSKLYLFATSLIIKQVHHDIF